MIRVNQNITLDEDELQFRFVRASGPGGQNVNKVATAVQLRFDVAHSRSLAPALKARLRQLAGRRMTRDGLLVIDARRHRTQERNRQDATARLVEWIRKAAQRPKPRIRTQPTAAAKRHRLEAKRRQSDKKRLRRL